MTSACVKGPVGGLILVGMLSPGGGASAGFLSPGRGIGGGNFGAGDVNPNVGGAGGSAGLMATLRERWDNPDCRDALMNLAITAGTDAAFFTGIGEAVKLTEASATLWKATRLGAMIASHEGSDALLKVAGYSAAATYREAYSPISSPIVSTPESFWKMIGGLTPGVDLLIAATDAVKQCR